MQYVTRCFLVAGNHLALHALLPALLLYSRISTSLLIYDEMVLVADNDLAPALVAVRQYSCIYMH